MLACFFYGAKVNVMVYMDVMVNHGALCVVVVARR